MKKHIIGMIVTCSVMTSLVAMQDTSEGFEKGLVESLNLHIEYGEGDAPGAGYSQYLRKTAELCNASLKEFSDIETWRTTTMGRVIASNFKFEVPIAFPVWEVSLNRDDSGKIRIQIGDSEFIPVKDERGYRRIETGTDLGTFILLNLRRGKEIRRGETKGHLLRESFFPLFYLLTRISGCHTSSLKFKKLEDLNGYLQASWGETLGWS